MTQKKEESLKGNTEESLTEMITLHDKDFNIVYANKAAKKFLNLPPSDVTKAKCYDTIMGNIILLKYARVVSEC
jgi:PAS domain-containing protein